VQHLQTSKIAIGQEPKFQKFLQGLLLNDTKTSMFNQPVTMMRRLVAAEIKLHVLKPEGVALRFLDMCRRFAKIAAHVPLHSAATWCCKTLNQVSCIRSCFAAARLCVSPLAQKNAPLRTFGGRTLLNQTSVIPGVGPVVFPIGGAPWGRD